MKLTKRIKLFAILAGILFIIFCPFAYLSPFKGKVIDAETKKPIEGAAVLVVYYNNFPTIAGSSISPADAQEAVTDSHGEFKISWKISWSWFGKLTWFPEADVNIFKPGYGVFPKHRRSEAAGDNKSWPSPIKYIVYEIPKLITVREREKNITFISKYDRIPYQKRKLYFKAINKERKNLGFSLYPLPID